LKSIIREQAIPQKVVHEIREGGELGDEILAERVSRGGVVREVEGEILIPLSMAKELAKLLNTQVALLESLISKKPGDNAEVAHVGK